MEPGPSWTGYRPCCKFVARLKAAPSVSERFCCFRTTYNSPTKQKNCPYHKNLCRHKKIVWPASRPTASRFSHHFSMRAHPCARRFSLCLICESYMEYYQYKSLTDYTLNIYMCISIPYISICLYVLATCV